MRTSGICHIRIICWSITGIGIPVTIARTRIVDCPLVLYLPHPIKSNTPLVYPPGRYSPYSSRSRPLILDPALLDHLEQNETPGHTLPICIFYQHYTLPGHPLQLRDSHCNNSPLALKGPASHLWPNPLYFKLNKPLCAL